MTLEEAVHNTKCDVLRTELHQFCVDIKANVIPTFWCPVCGADLRGSYQDNANQQKHPGQGICNVCHTGIQMRHRIEHTDHVVDAATGQLCAYEITMPVCLCSHTVSRMLKMRWEKTGLPCRPLTRTEFSKWMSEVQDIIKSVRIQ